MGMLLKHFRLLPDYFKLAVKRETEYKVGFYSIVFHQIFTILIWLIFWKVLIGKIGNFGSWGYDSMVLLTGFVTINMGLWLTFIYIWRLPQEILSGQLNIHLIKPIHPFLHILLQRLNLRSLPRVMFGLIIILFALIKYELPYDGISIFLACIMSMLSFLTSFLPFATICITAFWLGKADFLRDLFIELFVFQNYPLTEFPKLFIFIFSCVIPLIFSATVPVLVLTRWQAGKSLAVFGLLLVIICIQLLVFVLLWKRGLRRYESYGG